MSAWCLLPSSHYSRLHCSISSMHIFFPSYSVGSLGGEQQTPCRIHCTVFHFLLLSPLQLTLQLYPCLNSPPLVSVIVHGPLFFSILATWCFFVSPSVFSLIIRFSWGDVFHLLFTYILSLDKHILFYDSDWLVLFVKSHISSCLLDGSMWTPSVTLNSSIQDRDYNFLLQASLGYPFSLLFLSPVTFFFCSPSLQTAFDPFLLTHSI